MNFVVKAHTRTEGHRTAMITVSDHAKEAASALKQLCRVSPPQFDADGIAAVIEQAIRNATRERDTVVHARLSQLLACSPAVIYSYKASADFAPTFVSENIKEWLGYEPQEYLKDPEFWRSRVYPDELAHVEAQSIELFKKGRNTVEYRFRKKDGAYCWVSDAQRLIRDAKGQPAEIVGSWSDISLDHASRGTFFARQAS